MRITFTGPDGQLLTVTDTRAQQSDKPAVAIPRERRPAGYLLIQFTA
jgi:hypothetical protein